MKQHQYTTKLEWTGNEGKGTLNYRSYNRNHIISIAGKEESIKGSSDPSFRGDPSRYNPEELLVASLSACHMLWYLHLCSVNKIVVTDYIDEATGVMEESPDGSGKFSEVILHPTVTIENAELIAKAETLHAEAHKMCFIANSCNFPIRHQPNTKV